MDLTKLTKAQLIALIASAPVKAAGKSMADRRAVGDLTCGSTGKGHGKLEDGTFATVKGLAFHKAHAHKA